jgi:hypothetical protein
MRVQRNLLWTPKEDDELRSSILASKDTATIAKQLNRTQTAIRRRAAKLKLPLKVVGLKAKQIGPMTIRVIKHEVVPQTGSFEVRFSDGRPSDFFYWDDIPARRLSPQQMDSNRALEAAKALARSERDKIK